MHGVACQAAAAVARPRKHLIQQGVNSGWWLWRQMAVLAPPDIPSLREKLPKARPERRRHAVCQRGARMLRNRVARQEPMPCACRWRFFLQK